MQNIFLIKHSISFVEMSKGGLKGVAGGLENKSLKMEAETGKRQKHLNLFSSVKFICIQSSLELSHTPNPPCNPLLKKETNPPAALMSVYGLIIRI